MVRRYLKDIKTPISTKMVNNVSPNNSFLKAETHLKVHQENSEPMYAILKVAYTTQRQEL